MNNTNFKESDNSKETQEVVRMRIEIKKESRNRKERIRKINEAGSLKRPT